jgi:hypothetical protein
MARIGQTKNSLLPRLAPLWSTKPPRCRKPSPIARRPQADLYFLAEVTRVMPEGACIVPDVTNSHLMSVYGSPDRSCAAASPPVALRLVARARTTSGLDHMTVWAYRNHIRRVLRAIQREIHDVIDLKDWHTTDSHVARFPSLWVLAVPFARNYNGVTRRSQPLHDVVSDEFLRRPSATCCHVRHALIVWMKPPDATSCHLRTCHALAREHPPRGERQLPVLLRVQPRR